MSEWQPIETAPEDETVLVWAEDGWIMCADLILMSEYGGYDYCDGSRMWVDNDHSLLFRPTHWMPLPEPPK